MNRAAKPEVLIVDDDEGICHLVAEALAQGGIGSVSAFTGADALKALDSHGPLLTLLDLKLPDMDGRDIARMLGERQPRVPFIVISALSNTQVAVDLMKLGAVDFLIKDIGFLTLIPAAVRRALDARDRERKLREAEDALRESEERFRQIAENINEIFFITDTEMKPLYFSPVAETIFGRPRAKLEELSAWKEMIVHEDAERVGRWITPLAHGAKAQPLQFRIRMPGGALRWMEARAFPVKNQAGESYRIAGLISDITERRQLEQGIIDISEIERRRIGHDLHDDICQRLAAIKLKCEKLAHQLKKQSLPGTESASEVSAEIAATTALARDLARGLSPVDIEADGLTDAMARLCATGEKLHEIPVIFHCPQVVKVTSGTFATHLYRIAQELITNAARHGAPRQIDLTFASDADQLRLEVINDGTPFREPPDSSAGMGLRIMRYRAGVIGATLAIEARPGPRGGTRAVCLVPQSFYNPEIQP